MSLANGMIAATRACKSFPGPLILRIGDLPDNCQTTDESNTHNIDDAT
jgi:hypothetical protein